MARLHEYEGKELLREVKVEIPAGRAVATAREARKVAEEINGPVVVKMQAWTTKRAAMGGIKFANTPEEAEKAASDILSLEVKNFKVEKVMIEEKIAIKDEYYAGIIIDDSKSKPVIIFSSKGGSGIEEIAEEYPDCVARMHVDMSKGLRDYEARGLIRKTGISGKLQMKLAGVLVKLYKVARKYEARSAEINPLVQTEDGKIMAADCRITVDDYAVFRHPELGIEVAREFDRPPTELDLISYNVEADDYRGTFYFIQMEQAFKKGENFVGFHGAGGGGSMMSMDAALSKGFKIANFCDTSGNPPASKVYRAAKIIMSQKGIDAYFGSGSGVASQEQFHSARGLVKAFREECLSIPAVVRLGGNMEDKAIQILTEYTKDLPAPVEGYGKDDSADFCAGRLRLLVDEFKKQECSSNDKKKPVKSDYSFKTITGTVYFDHNLCRNCESKVCVKECAQQILKIENDVPVLAITEEDAAKGKCSECLACEVECFAHGKGGGFVELPIEGLDAYRAKGE